MRLWACAPRPAELRKVSGNGHIYIGNRPWKVSQALASERVELKRVDQRILIFFCQTLVQEARRRAVENAVAKATVYATSLGLSTVRPIALSDPGMLGDGSAPVQPVLTMMPAATSAATDESASPSTSR